MFSPYFTFASNNEQSGTGWDGKRLLSVPSSLCSDVSVFRQVHTKVSARIRVSLELG